MSWLKGETAAGVTVEIDTDPYVNQSSAVVMIGGERAKLLRVTRRRDGGTTTITTDRGVIWWPRRLGAPTRPAQFEGREIHPEGVLGES